MRRALDGCPSWASWSASRSFLYAPRERAGNVQHHVTPRAGRLTAYLAFALVFVGASAISSRGGGWTGSRWRRPSPACSSPASRSPRARSGASRLGHVVDLGRAPDVDRRAVPRLCRLLCCAAWWTTDRRARAAAVVGSWAPRTVPSCTSRQWWRALHSHPPSSVPSPRPSRQSIAATSRQWIAFTLSSPIC